MRTFISRAREQTNIDVHARSCRHNGLILRRQSLPFVLRLVLVFRKASNDGGGGSALESERGEREGEED